MWLSLLAVDVPFTARELDSDWIMVSFAVGALVDDVWEGDAVVSDMVEMLLFELLSLNNFANRLTKEASINRKQYKRKSRLTSDLTAQFKYVEDLIVECIQPDR